MGATRAEAPIKRPRAALRRARWLRRLSWGLIVAGVATIAWSFVVWRWDDPATSLYTRWQQAKLNDRYATIVEHTRHETVAPRTVSRAEASRMVQRSATTLKSTSREGDPIGRIIVPRLALNMVVVNGTDSSSLRKGPGRDLRTLFPGQGQLVYIAGHRTTFAAPFAHIDSLVRGDRVTLKMPYGTFVYSVTGHSIVAATDMSVLRSRGREVVALQACHPRFLATQRYIVWATPVTFSPIGGRTYRLP
jgi:sortase A